MLMNTFHTDLDRGIKIELKALEVIKKSYACATLISAFKGYDIWIPGCHKSVEVKYDPMSNKTGNIVVEIEMSGKPSALLTTTADYWLFYDDNIFVLIKPMTIIKCILLNKLVHTEFTAKGDYNSKKAFLIQKEVLFNYGEKLEG